MRGRPGHGVANNPQPPAHIRQFRTAEKFSNHSLVKQPSSWHIHEASIELLFLFHDPFLLNFIFLRFCISSVITCLRLPIQHPIPTSPPSPPRCVWRRVILPLHSVTIPNHSIITPSACSRSSIPSVVHASWVLRAARRPLRLRGRELHLTLRGDLLADEQMLGSVLSYNLSNPLKMSLGSRVTRYGTSIELAIPSGLQADRLPAPFCKIPTRLIPRIP